MGSNEARNCPRRPRLLRHPGLATSPNAAHQPGRANEKAGQLCAINPDIPGRGTVQQTILFSLIGLSKGD
ncbi:hypothetical protein N7537_009272 [Penicillium hordei]|uniref:Uncharacterized protein n=1 Tax=Penicillium hordei TaxID=40994 RepID=A0AAD6DSE7_9EURO|nr:uncharacterized protein N7537_009272 [Penicillium hordei]KAJ5592368.1 hypothetical protein N7537_009272 [Penicillium hordei]